MIKLVKLSSHVYFIHLGSIQKLGVNRLHILKYLFLTTATHTDASVESAASVLVAVFVADSALLSSWLKARVAVISSITSGSASNRESLGVVLFTLRKLTDTGRLIFICYKKDIRVRQLQPRQFSEISHVQ
jgi:hypothetical protein